MIGIVYPFSALKLTQNFIVGKINDKYFLNRLKAFNKSINLNYLLPFNYNKKFITSNKLNNSKEIKI